MDPASAWQIRAYYLHVFDGWSIQRIADEFRRSVREVQTAVDAEIAEAEARNAVIQGELKRGFDRQQQPPPDSGHDE